MQRFCANISMLYQETDFLQRYQWAAEDGFRYVECLFPYAYQARVIKVAADQAGVTQHLFNTYPGVWQQGDRGLACHADKVAAFRHSIHQALDYAHTLHTSLLHVMAGVCPTLHTPAMHNKQFSDAEKVYIENMRWAAEQAQKANITLTIEAINPIDMPHYLITTQAQAMALLQAIGANNVKLQFDFYHCEKYQGNSLAWFKKYHKHIAHTQIAGVPERHEPNIGDFNYQAVLSQLDTLHYAGRIGCEYHPKTTTRAGLGWLSQLLDNKVLGDKVSDDD